MMSNFDQTSPETLSLVADYFKVLSEVSRLQILNCLREKPMNGKQIAEETGLGQANLSKHLKVLTQAGVLKREQQGVSVYYRIKDPMIFELCELVCGTISNEFQERAESFSQLSSFNLVRN
ncbi:ArsR/SmtB family transcription factor [Dactylococcopsis salina]|uniref:Transcriptional regulator n=1 Tax=Dactylococcopsis salina (strain PCC 8305) TaxID=13035 RepID=K9YWH1_DACS8|nr:putative transcriptional regulator [Dactylococcopsis salina PCC 8305]